MLCWICSMRKYPLGSLYGEYLFLGVPWSNSKTSWWFGTFFIFPYIWKNNPNWISFFRGLGIPPIVYSFPQIPRSCGYFQDRVDRASHSSRSSSTISPSPAMALAEPAPAPPFAPPARPAGPQGVATGDWDVTQVPKQLDEALEKVDAVRPTKLG